MTYNYKGKHVSVSMYSPEALGICDYSGFVHNRKDLIRQMEWRGNALVWTGFYVGKTYADRPNEQLRPPILPPDPVPVREPRLQQPTNITWSNNFNSTWSTLPVYSWGSWSGNEDGVPCLPQDERLSLLKKGGIPGSPNISSGGEIPMPYLNTQQRLQALQQFNWDW